MKTTLPAMLLLHHPDKQLREMQNNGRLDNWLPEIAQLSGVSQPPAFHPEGDAFEHTMQVLVEMRKLTSQPERLFAALVHDVGKGITPIELLPKHHNHEKNGVAIVEELAVRLGVPKGWKDAGLYGTEYHGKFHCLLDMRPPRIVDFLNEASKSALGVEGLAQLGLADTRGRNNPDGTHECYEAWLEMWAFVKQNPAYSHERPDDTRMRHAKGIKEIQKRHKNG